jgi:hypothetical protein
MPMALHAIHSALPTKSSCRNPIAAFDFDVGPWSDTRAVPGLAPSFPMPSPAPQARRGFYLATVFQSSERSLSGSFRLLSAVKAFQRFRLRRPIAFHVANDDKRLKLELGATSLCQLFYATPARSTQEML